MLMKVKASEVGTLIYLQKHQIKNVIRLFEIIDLEDKLILVMDYCDGGQILDWNSSKNLFQLEGDSKNLLPEAMIKEYFI